MSNNNGHQSSRGGRIKASKKTANTKESSALSSWGAKLYTLNTIDAYSASNHQSKNSTDSYSSTSVSSSRFKIQHIPTLPSSDYAKSILERIQNEFQIIAQKRGYNLTSVTEMCCCDDGFNHLANNKSGGRKRGRKIRAMPDNVLGYNLTQGYRRGRGNGRYGNSIHRIHLRLRHPKRHGSFYPYEDIAGTMCHELAHCEVGAHNAKFYKLMDEIMEQYSIFLVRGLVLDKGGFPMGSQESHTLGGGSGSNSSNNNNAAGRAARQRLEQKTKYGLGGSYVLGGGMSYIQDVKNMENQQKQNGFNIYGNRLSSIVQNNVKASSSLASLLPREAALIAAEARLEQRRSNDSKFCLPCQEIIEILSESSDEEEDDMHDTADVKPPKYQRIKCKSTYQKQSEQAKDQKQTIDLIDDESSCDATDNKQLKQPEQAKHQKQIIDLIDDASSCDESYKNRSKTKIKEKKHDGTSQSWSCATCTFAQNKKLSLACEVCASEREPTNLSQITIKMARKDLIEDVKKKEKEQCMKEFNGFNIYGNDKRSTATLNHLT